MPIMTDNEFLISQIVIESNSSTRTQPEKPWDILGSYFVKYLKQIKSGTEKLPVGSLPEEKLNQLLAMMQSLIMNEARIQQIDIASEKGNSKALEELTVDLARNILTLPETSRILLPGGWHGAKGGYRLLYQFEKLSSGKIRFLIYNTGNSHQYHEKKSSNSKEEYYPVLVYETALTLIKVKDFAFFLLHLITPQLKQHPNKLVKPPEAQRPISFVRRTKLPTYNELATECPHDNVLLSYNDQLYYLDWINQSLPLIERTENNTAEYQKTLEAMIYSWQYADATGTKLANSLISFPKEKTSSYWTINNFIQYIHAVNTWVSAEPVPAANFLDEQLTTANDVLNHNHQQLIYEVLKINLADRMVFQKVILGFRLFALQDLIRSTGISASDKHKKLIDKAVKKTLFLIQTASMFDESDTVQLEQKRVITEQLIAIQEQVISGQLVPMPAASIIRSFKEKTTSNIIHITQRLNVPKEDNKPYHEKPGVDDEIRSIDSGANLLNDLENIVDACRRNQQTDLFWTLTQIEHVVNRLPLPDNPMLFKKDDLLYMSVSQTDCYPDIEFYQTINHDAENYKRLIEALDSLQKIHIDTHQKLYGKRQLPQYLLTQCSFLALRDYFDVYIKKSLFNTQKQEPILHAVFAEVLYQVFAEYSKFSPYFAGQDIALDLRFNQLKHLYLTPVDISFISSYVRDLYKIIVKSSEGDYKYLQYKIQNTRDGYMTLELKCLQHLFSLLDMSGESFVDTFGLHELPFKILQQLSLERCFARGVAALSNRELEFQTIKVYGQFQKSGGVNSELRYYVWVYTPLTYNNGVDKRQFVALEETNNAHLTHQQYAIPYSPARQALLEKTSAKKTANEIEITPYDNDYERLITKQDLFNAEMRQLRVSSPNQINYVIEFFREAFEKLSEPNIQCFVQACIFEPGLLNDTFKKDPQFLNQFDEWITSGRNNCIDELGQLNQMGLFFIRLSGAVNRYIIQDPALISRFKEEQALLTALIQTQKNPMILTSLHESRFLTIVSIWHQDNTPPCEKDIYEAYCSYFYMHAKSNYAFTHDAVTLAFIKRVEYQFRRIMQPCQISPDLMNSIINQLGIVIDQGTIIENKSDNSLRCQSLDKTCSYIVNKNSGRIYKDNKVYSAVPSDLKEHLLLKKLGLEKETSCFISKDGALTEFSTVNSEIRIIRENSSLRVQRKWEINQEKDWYELCPLSTEQQTFLNLGPHSSPVIENNLPMIFRDGTLDAWVKTSKSGFFNFRDKAFMFLARGDTLCYRINEKNVLIEVENPISLLQSDCSRQEDLIYFEDPKFFSIFATNTDKKGKIQRGVVHFSRYGISLTISNASVTLADTDLQLLSHTQSPFLSEVACLNFASMTNSADKQCIVPVQQFYLDPNKGGDSASDFPFTQDLSGKIPQMLLERHKLLNKIWSYTGSSQYITYNLIDNKPQFNKQSDGLYLCYLYLMSNQPERALEIVSEISKGAILSGSIEELTFLSWIVQDLTYPINLDESLDSTYLKTPLHLVCQLKALSLLTDYFEQGNVLQLPNKSLCDFNWANGHYQAICIDNIHKFYANLPEIIYTLYSQLQSVREELPEDIFVNYFKPTDRKSVLNFYKLKVSPNAPLPGAIGYEWQVLNATILQQLLRYLQANQVTGVLSAKSERDLKRISSTFQNQVSIAKKSTELQLTPIDLSIKEAIGWETENLIATWQQTWSIMNWTKIQLAMSLLSLDMTEEKFLDLFPCYLYMMSVTPYTMSVTPECSSAQEQIKGFCESYLRLHYHGGFSNVPRDKIAYWTNVLYRVCHRTDALSECPSELIKVLDRSIFTYKPKLILVYSPKDVFENTLTTSHEIYKELEAAQTNKKIESLETPVLNVEKLSMKALIRSIVEGVDSSISTSCKNLVDEYTDTENSYNRHVKNVTDGLPENPTRQQLNSAEQKTGRLKYDCVQQQRDLAQRYLSNKSLQGALKQRAVNLENQLRSELENLWNKTISLASKKSSDLKQALQYRVELAAGIRLEPTKDNLLNLYLKAEKSGYRALNFFTEAEIETLHQSLHQCVTYEVQRQHFSRLVDSIEQAQKSSDPALSHEIAEVLFSENTLIAANDPTLMVMQYRGNMLLRMPQAIAIQRLCEKDPKNNQYQNSIQKLPPGAGKSTVILPALSEKKATGLNLVIYLIPRALLPTTHASLNNTTQSRYGKKACRFEFNRDSDCSSGRLQQIHQFFNEIIINKNYLVTSPETMQSLDLKYRELLLSKPQGDENIEEWRKQVHWAGKISSLIKQCGDATIDEVHDVLLLKKRLNYTFGIPKAVSPNLIRHHIQLYTFLQAISHRETPGNEFNDKASRKKMIEKSWPKLLPRLIDLLLDDPLSPLADYIKQFQVVYPQYSRVREELRAYLNNEADSQIISTSTNSALQDAFAFYKEQANLELGLLGRTLGRTHKEHYGPSTSSEKDALQKVLAVPYAANEKPKDVPGARSRFANPSETINYTIQSLLLNGLNKEILAELIRQWQRVARFESINDYARYPRIDDTPTANLIGSYLEGSGFTLGQLDPENETQIEQLLHHVQFNDSLIFSVLEEKILCELKIEPSILQNNCYDSVEQYNTVQGLSGTPSNWRSMHPKLKFDYKTSLGSDGYILEVMKEKHTSVYVLDFTELDDYFDALPKTIKNWANTRAIIDVCATFAGIKNRTVAKALAKKLAKSKSEVQFVLYFNDNDVLCALNVNSPDKSIVIERTDAATIYSLLKCGPEACFTYYDQAHTFGADIKQAPNSNAIAFVKKDTKIDFEIQGAKRMRGLEKGQTIEIIVPSDFSPRAETAGVSLDEAFSQAQQNQDDYLSEEIFEATLGKMENIIRRDLRARINSLTNLENLDDEAIDVEEIEKKHQWANAFRPFFVDDQEDNLYLQYGAINTKQPSETILTNYQTYLVNQWKECLAKVGVTDVAPVEAIMNTEIKTLINDSIPHCKEKSLCRGKQSTQGMETEVQKEIEVEMVPDIDSPKANYTKALIAREETALSFDAALCLNNFCPRWENGELAVVFSNNLKLTENYAWTYLNQEELLCPFIKPAHAIYFSKVDVELEAYLVTDKEVEEIQAKPELYLTQGRWLSTSKEHILGGKKPIDMDEDVEYRKLLEQIRYFLGQVRLLLDQKTTYVWINENPSEKLAFLREKVMPNRYGNARELYLLESVLLKKTQTYPYVQEHIFDNLNQADWKKLVPGISDIDLRVYQNLGREIQSCNDWFVSNSQEKRSTKSHLPPTAQLIVRNHIKKLESFLQVLDIVSDGFNFLQLEDEQRKTLSYILQFNVDELIRQFEVDDRSNGVSNAFINLSILMTMRQCTLLQNNTQMLTRLDGCIQNNILLKEQSNTLKAPLTQAKVLVALFKNTHEQMTDKHFGQLQAYRQSPESLREQLKHRFFRFENLKRFFDTLKKDPTLFRALYEEILAVSGGELSINGENPPDDLPLCTLVAVYAMKFAPNAVPVILQYIQEMSVVDQINVLTYSLNGMNALNVALEQGLIASVLKFLLSCFQVKPKEAAKLISELGDDDFYKIVKNSELEHLIILLEVFEKSEISDLQTSSKKRLELLYQMLLEKEIVPLNLLEKVVAVLDTYPSLYALMIKRISEKGDPQSLMVLLSSEGLSAEQKMELVQRYANSNAMLVPLDEPLISMILVLNPDILLLESLAFRVDSFNNLNKFIDKMQGQQSREREILLRLIQTKRLRQTLLLDILLKLKNQSNEQDLATLLETILDVLAVKTSQDAILHDTIILEIARQANRLPTYILLLDKRVQDARTIISLREIIATKTNLVASLEECVVSNKLINNVFLRKIQDYEKLQSKLLCLCVALASTEGQDFDQKHKIVMTVNELMRRVVKHPNCNQTVCRHILKKAVGSDNQQSYQAAVEKWQLLTRHKWNELLSDLSSELSPQQKTQIHSLANQIVIDDHIEGLAWLEQGQETLVRRYTMTLMYGVAFAPAIVPLLLSIIQSKSGYLSKSIIEDAWISPITNQKANVITIALQRNPKLVMALIETAINTVGYEKLSEYGIVNAYPKLTSLLDRTKMNTFMYLLRHQDSKAVSEALQVVLNQIQDINPSIQKSMLWGDEVSENDPLILAIENHPECASRLWIMITELDSLRGGNLIRQLLPDDACKKLIGSMSNDEHSQLALAFPALKHGGGLLEVTPERMVLIYSAFFEMQTISRDLFEKILNRNRDNELIIRTFMQRAKRDPIALQLLLTGDIGLAQIESKQQQVIHDFVLSENVLVDEQSRNMFLTITGLNDETLFNLAVQMNQFDHFTHFIYQMKGNRCDNLCQAIQTQKLNPTILLGIIQSRSDQSLAVSSEETLIKTNLQKEPSRSVIELQALKRKEGGIKRIIENILKLDKKYLSDEVIVAIAGLASDIAAYKSILKLTVGRDCQQKIYRMLVNDAYLVHEIVNTNTDDLLLEDIICLPSISAKLLEVYVRRASKPKDVSTLQNCNVNVYNAMLYERGVFLDFESRLMEKARLAAWEQFHEIQKYLPDPNTSAARNDLKKKLEFVKKRLDHAEKFNELQLNLRTIRWPDYQDDCDGRTKILLYTIGYFPELVEPIIGSLIETTSPEKQLELLKQTNYLVKEFEFDNPFSMAVKINSPVALNIIGTFLKLKNTKIAEEGVLKAYLNDILSHDLVSTYDYFLGLLGSKDANAVTMMLELIQLTDESIQRALFSAKPNVSRELFPAPLLLLLETAMHNHPQLAVFLLNTIMKVMPAEIPEQSLGQIGTNLKLVNWEYLIQAATDSIESLAILSKMLVYSLMKSTVNFQSILPTIFRFYAENSALRVAVQESLLNALEKNDDFNQDAVLLWTFLTSKERENHLDYERLLEEFSNYQKTINRAYLLYNFYNERNSETKIAACIVSNLEKIAPRPLLSSVGFFKSYFSTLPWMLLSLIAGRTNSGLESKFITYVENTNWNQLIEQTHQDPVFIETLLNGLAKLDLRVLSLLLSHWDLKSWKYLVTVVNSSLQHREQLDEIIIKFNGCRLVTAEHQSNGADSTTVDEFFKKLIESRKERICKEVASELTKQQGFDNL